VRRDLLFVAAVAAAIFALQATAWPLTKGRDFESYLLYFNQVWDSPPAWPGVMLFRTPVAPFFIGGLHKLGGPPLLEVTLGACFVLTICAVYAIGATWSRAVAWAAALLTAGYPTYGATFHLLTADALLACGAMVWMAFVCRSIAPTTSVGRFVGHGVAVFLLIMTRPAAQTLLLFAAFPFIVLRQLDLRRRALLSTAFAAAVGALLLLYATYNLIRYEDFTVMRTRAALVPFYRVLVLDRIVHPDNGPATRELVRAIEQDLINHEPYRSMGLDVPTILGSADPRVWADLAALSDHVWGWNSDYAILRAVAFEAIQRHPGAYVGGVGASVYSTLTDRSVPQAARRPPEASVRSPSKPITPRPGSIPPPSYFGWLLPHSYRNWLASGPPGRSKAATPDTRWRIPSEAFRLPVREGSEALAIMLRDVAALYPTILVFLVIGVVGVGLLSFHESRWLFLFLAGLGAVHVVFICASTTLSVYYRTPFDPIFIVLGVAGFMRAANPLSPLTPAHQVDIGQRDHARARAQSRASQLLAEDEDHVSNPAFDPGNLAS
jgi:hypothetical protein